MAVNLGHRLRVILANIVAIYQRELQSYFVSPLAYGVASIFWLIAGIFFVAVLLGPAGIIAQSAMRDMQGQQMGIPVPPIDVPYEFLKIYLGSLGSLSLFILPILSMSLYTEERKRGTIELLATSPITNWAVALGKLLGVLTFFASILAPILLLELIVLAASNPPISPWVAVSGHLGLLLMGGGVLSLGMFLSSLTASTVLAAMMTFALNLSLWIIDLLANAIGGDVGQAIGHLSLLKHYEAAVRGVPETGSAILFLSYILLGIFLTAQSVETFRFQRS
nr:ABC transporter permease subunit [Limnothrix sp. FACHB-881]